jgi:hypothetical protein
MENRESSGSRPAAPARRAAGGEPIEREAIQTFVYTRLKSRAG